MNKMMYINPYDKIPEHTRSLEEISNSLDVILDITNNHNILQWIVEKNKLNIDQVEKIAFKPITFELQCLLVEKFKINQKIFDHFRTNTSSMALLIELMRKTEIPFEERKKCLTKKLMNRLIHDQKWDQFSFEQTKKRFPKDIRDEINKSIIIKDIIK